MEGLNVFAVRSQSYLFFFKRTQGFGGGRRRFT